MISIVSASIIAAWVLVMEQKGEYKGKGEPMKMGGRGGEEGEKNTRVGGEEKKEL